jgi:hypothetical protein
MVSCIYSPCKGWLWQKGLASRSCGYAITQMLGEEAGVACLSQRHAPFRVQVRPYHSDLGIWGCTWLLGFELSSARPSVSHGSMSRWSHRQSAGGLISAQPCITALRFKNLCRQVLKNGLGSQRASC